MPTATYRYRAHGLTFHSEIELPELAPGEGDADVVIRFGTVPARLEGPVSTGPCFEAVAGQCLIELPRVARYWVKGADEIVIAPAPGARQEDVRVFVLSSAMAAIAHQRGLLAMHASGIEVDGRCVLFAGESGAGKSTLTAAFHDRGYRIVSDDLCVIAFDAAGTPMVHSGYRHVKLWADSLAVVGRTLGERRRQRVGMQKYCVSVPGAGLSATLPVALIFLLSTKLADRVELQSLTGRAKINALLRETYRRRMSAALGHRTSHFKQCAALGSRVRMVLVHRPLYLSGISRLADVLEREMRAGHGDGT
jgi:predicted ATPase